MGRGNQRSWQFEAPDWKADLAAMKIYKISVRLAVLAAVFLATFTGTTAAQTTGAPFTCSVGSEVGNSQIASTIGIGNNVPANQSYTLYPGTNLTYQITGPIGEFDTVVAGLQGDAIRFRAPDLSGTGYSMLMTYNSSVGDVSFKLVDFDDLETITVTARDANGDIYDLTTPGLVTVGSQISQSGNTFSGAIDNAISGDDPANDAIASLVFNLPSLSTLEISVPQGSGVDGSIRFPEMDFAYCPPSDLSDAPISGTSYGEAAHEIDTSILLGAAIDADTTSIANTGATGDGADDDGANFPTLTQGASATISVDVQQVAGNDGYLQGWIDWNGDDDFDDAGEQIAANLQSASAGTSTINVPISVPISATTNQTFARFRWSTTQNLDTTSAAPDGEVEDYAVSILAPPTFSCAPDFGQVYGDSGTIGVMDLNSQSFIVLGSVGQRLNASGFRPSDGYVYGIGDDNTLYRIGSDGSATDLGVVAGLPIGLSQTANQGDFGPDGHLHIRYGDNGTIYRVNVDTATLDGSYTLTPYINQTADFAYVANRNLFIGVRGFGAAPRIYAFSPNTGASQSLGLIDPGFSGVSFGAAFADSTGAFFAVNNSDGTLYEFNPDIGEAVALGRGAPATLNDGFM